MQYQYLSPFPAKWTGTCILIYIAPKIDIAPNNQSFEVPLTSYFVARRGTALLLLLASLGIAIDLGTGIEGLATSFSYDQNLPSAIQLSSVDRASA